MLSQYRLSQIVLSLPLRCYAPQCADLTTIEVGMRDEISRAFCFGPYPR